MTRAGLKVGTSVWPLALEALGWLIVAAGGIVVVLTVVASVAGGGELFMLLPVGGGIASAAIFLGGIPIVNGRAARRQGTPARWRLWAKILLLLGGSLCISIPSMAYGILPAGIQVARLTDLNQDPNAEFSPLDPQLVFGTLVLGIPSFLAGIFLVVPALIWGRQRTTAASPLASDELG